MVRSKFSVSAARAPGAYGGRDGQVAAAEFGLRRR